MIKTALTFLFTFSFIISYAQADDSLSSNIYQTNGFLGIGNSQPEYLLDIHADADKYSLTPRQFIRLNNTNNTIHSNVAISMQSGTDANKSAGSIGVAAYSYEANTGLQGYTYMYSPYSGIALRAANENGQIKFIVGGADTSAERMRICANGNVGIGTSEPIEKLHLSGGLLLGNTESGNNGTMRWNGDDFEGYKGDEWVSLTSQPSETQSVWQTIGSDIRYTNGKVGIGSNSPEFLLDINADADNSSTHPRQFIRLNNTNNTIHSNVAISMQSGTDANNAAGSIGVAAYSYEANTGLQGYTYMYSPYSGIALRAANENGQIKFIVGGADTSAERMRINANGNVGIGTSEPKAKLHVEDGDVYISNINRGVVMVSPNGQCWRGQINNDGQLEFSAIDCPETEAALNSKQVEYTESTLTIYPNPTNDEITLNINSYTGNTRMYYELVSLNGVLLKKDLIESNQSQINISQFPSGLYILRVLDENNIVLKSQEVVKN